MEKVITDIAGVRVLGTLEFFSRFKISIQICILNAHCVCKVQC
jgi:hypothetical protein